MNDRPTPLTDAIRNTPLMGETVTEHKWDKMTELARRLERRLRDAEYSKRYSEEAAQHDRDALTIATRARIEAEDRAEAAELRLAERDGMVMVPRGCEILCGTCRLPPITENIVHCDSGAACPLKYMLTAAIAKATGE